MGSQTSSSQGVVSRGAESWHGEQGQFPESRFKENFLQVVLLALKVQGILHVCKVKDEGG